MYWHVDYPLGNMGRRSIAHIKLPRRQGQMQLKLGALQFRQISIFFHRIFAFFSRDFLHVVET
jgi:hypothetical protein